MAEVPARFREHLPADGSAEALFFWCGTLAVQTDYGLFVEHWDDFCHLSDDSNVLVLPGVPKAAMYRNDRWYILDRVDGQPLFPLRQP